MNSRFLSSTREGSNEFKLTVVQPEKVFRFRCEFCVRYAVIGRGRAFDSVPNRKSLSLLLSRLATSTKSEINMKVLRLLIITSIIALTAARVAGKSITIIASRPRLLDALMRPERHFTVPELSHDQLKHHLIGNWASSLTITLRS